MTTTEAPAPSRITPNDTTPLGEAREWFLRAADTAEGEHCPCCSAYHRTYHRKLYDAQVRCLVRAFAIDADRQARGEPDLWVDWPADVEPRGGDGVKLHHWGFIERASTSKDPGDRLVGRYRLTEAGRDFVKGRHADGTPARAPHAAWLRKGDTFVRWCTVRDRCRAPKVSIADVFGVPFDFHDLLSGASVDEVLAALDERLAEEAEASA